MECNRERLQVGAVRAIIRSRLELKGGLVCARLSGSEVPVRPTHRGSCRPGQNLAQAAVDCRKSARGPVAERGLEPGGQPSVPSSADSFLDGKPRRMQVLCLTNTVINQVDRVARTSRPWVVSLVPEGIFGRLVRGTPNNGLSCEFARQHTKGRRAGGHGEAEEHYPSVQAALGGLGSAAGMVGERAERPDLLKQRPGPGT